MWSSEEIWNILPSPELQPWINCAQGQTNWNVMLPSCFKIFLETFTNISAKQQMCLLQFCLPVLIFFINIYK